MLLSGVTVTVKVAHVRLCHSRMLFVRSYSRETQEMVFDAHNRAFALFRGSCGRGIHDNNETAVEELFVDRTGSTIAASCKCAATIWSSQCLHAGVGVREGSSRRGFVQVPRSTDA